MPATNSGGLNSNDIITEAQVYRLNTSMSICSAVIGVMVTFINRRLTGKVLEYSVLSVCMTVNVSNQELRIENTFPSKVDDTFLSPELW